MTRIVVNQYYIHENNLVKVIGASGMTRADTLRYLIEWQDANDERRTAEVKGRELSAAPTMERLYQDYRQSLNAICSQANHIEELEATSSLFQCIMEASAVYVTRFGGEVEFQGAIRKMHEEYEEVQKAVIKYAQACTDDTPMSLRLKTPRQFRSDVVHEMIDLFVTVGGVAHVLGITWDDIESAGHATLDKLDKRTTEDYAWNPETRTVERKDKIKP